MGGKELPRDGSIGVWELAPTEQKAHVRRLLSKKRGEVNLRVIAYWRVQLGMGGKRAFWHHQNPYKSQNLMLKNSHCGFEGIGGFSVLFGEKSFKGQKCSEEAGVVKTSSACWIL